MKVESKFDPKPLPTEVILTLSYEEAKALYTIAGGMTGPEGPFRSITNELYDKLHKIEGLYEYSDGEYMGQRFTGKIE